MRYSLILGALMGLLVAGLFLPTWIVPLMIFVGAFGGLVVWVFLDDDYLRDSYREGEYLYGLPRLEPIGTYQYPYPNHVVAIWNDPAYIAAYNRV